MRRVIAFLITVAMVLVMGATFVFANQSPSVTKDPNDVGGIADGRDPSVDGDRGVTSPKTGDSDINTIFLMSGIVLVLVGATCFVRSRKTN